MKLDHYVGRIVRLNQRAFQEISELAKYQGGALENCFLVAKASGKLVCYGATHRIDVSPADVILV